MSRLEHPAAVALRSDAEISVSDVRGCRRRLEGFLQRYLPRFYREEQRELAQVVVQGKRSNLQRQTSEPIAYLAGRERKPVQHFVGAGCWDDESVLAELRQHVGETRADPDGVLVLDPSGFPKKGEASCGVARQWCGLALAGDFSWGWSGSSLFSIALTMGFALAVTRQRPKLTARAESLLGALGVHA